MAVLEKIRVKMGVFITVIIGIALLSFIIDPSTLQSAMSMFSSEYDVGEMNGESITYQDFQKKVDYFTNIHQLISGSSSVDEKTQEMINQAAWQDFISDRVMIPEISRAGIAVGDEELFDMSQGANISPVLKREQMFLGADGNFDRNRLVEFLKSVSQDPSGNSDAYWRFLEKNMLMDQMFTKYISILEKSNVLNTIEMKRSIVDNNMTSDVSFVMKPFSFVGDSSVTVSKQEIKRYYDAHKSEFEQKASRDIDYVVFAVEPSEVDIELAKRDIDKAFEEFVKTDNMKGFLLKNSEKQLIPYLFKKGELASLSTALEEFAFSAKAGDVMPVTKEGNVFSAAKIMEIKRVPDSINVEHILLDNSNKAVAKAKADSLIALLSKGADFGKLASENSLDKNPNAASGQLGWMTQSYLLPGFEVCFDKEIGKLFTIETNYGLHIVKIKEKTAPISKVQVAILEKTALAGKETFRNYYSQANELVSRAHGDINKFYEAAKEQKLSVIPANGIKEGAKSVATYNNARELSSWAYKAKKGDVSEIITIDNRYFFIAALTGVHKEGIPSVEEMSATITTILMKEKYHDLELIKVKEEIKGLANLDDIATKLGSTVSNQTGVAFGSPGANSFDPIFIGAVCGAKENQITGPVKGAVGIYIFNVTKRETGDFFSEQDAKNRAMQFNNYQMQILPMVMQKGADVKDNRGRFF